MGEMRARIRVRRRGKVTECRGEGEDRWASIPSLQWQTSTGRLCVRLSESGEFGLTFSLWKVAYLLCLEADLNFENNAP